MRRRQGVCFLLKRQQRQTYQALLPVCCFYQVKCQRTISILLLFPHLLSHCFQSVILKTILRCYGEIMCCIPFFFIAPAEIFRSTGVARNFHLMPLQMSIMYLYMYNIYIVILKHYLREVEVTSSNSLTIESYFSIFWFLWKPCIEQNL